MENGRGFRRLGIPAFLLVVATWAAGQSSCAAANGLYLASSGGRLGDPWFVGVNGNTGVSGYLGVDLAAGPTSTPIGPMCLGLTSNLQLVPFALGGSGAFSLGGILAANPALTGLTVFLQAAGVDAGQPGGYAVSNGASVTLRPPRAFLIYQGDAPTAIGGSFCRYDAITQTVTPAVAIPGFVLDAVMVPALNWLAVLTTNSMLRCYDADTGASVLNQSLLSPFGAPPPSKLAMEGTTLYTMHQAGVAPFGPGVHGGLRSFSLPSGAPGFACVLSSGDPKNMMILPGQGIAYLRSANDLIPVDLVTGTQLPTIATGVSPGTAAPLNTMTEWVRVGNVLYCLIPGAAPNNPYGLPVVQPVIVAIDTLSHTVMSPSPVQLDFFSPSRLRYGPGTNGNAIFVWSANPPSLRQLDPVSLSTTGSTGVAGTLIDLALSPGGSEWLIVAGYPFSIQSMNPQTLAVTTVTSYPAYNSFLSPIPNATIRRAFTVDEFEQLHPFGTDSATAPVATVSVPLPSVSRVVVD